MSKPKTGLDCPIFIDPDGKEHQCIAWAIGLPQINWEWYGFENDPADPDIYFGYVMGVEDEWWGYFSAAELKERGIRLIVDRKSLNEIRPPIGWRKKEVK